MSCTVTSTCTGTGVSSGIADLEVMYNYRLIFCRHNLFLQFSCRVGQMCWYILVYLSRSYGLSGRTILQNLVRLIKEKWILRPDFMISSWSLSRLSHRGHNGDRGEIMNGLILHLKSSPAVILHDALNEIRWCSECPIAAVLIEGPMTMRVQTSREKE